MALPYRSVKDLYDTLHDSGAVSASMPDWSDEMNRLTESDLYSAGLHDNFVKHASVGLDRLLEASGVPGLTGTFGRGVGSLVGVPEAGQRIGEGLPRMATNFLPLVAGPWGLPAVAALSGAETYTDTGSPASGLLSAATNVLMPGVAGAAEKVALNRLGTGALGKVGSFLAGQTAAASLGEASGFGQDVLQGQPLHNPFTVENLLNLTLGQTPFAAMHLAGKAYDAVSGRGAEREANAAQAIKLAEQRQAETIAKEQNPLADIPEWKSPELPNPKVVAETSFLLGKLRGEKLELLNEATPESMAEYNKRSQDEQRLIDEQRGVTGGKDTVGGEILDPTSERFNVVGETHFVDPQRGGVGYRIIKAADDPANIDQGIKPGELISYSMLHEPPPQGDPLGTGKEVYSIPSRFHTRDIVDRYAQEADAAALRQQQYAEQNPTLPAQERSLNLEAFRAQQAKLSDLEKRMDTAATSEDVRRNFVDLNNARLEAGFKPLDDARLQEYMDTYQLKDMTAAQRAQLRKLQRNIEAKRVHQEQADALFAQLQKPREDAAQTGTVTDPEALKLANDIQGIFTASGLGLDHFNRILLKWEQEGRKNDVQGLSDLVYSARRTGKGRQKIKGPEDKVEDAVAKKSDATQPIADMRTELASVIVQRAGEANPDQWDALANWHDWVESGTKKLPEHLANNPHVEEWNDALRQYLQVAAEKNLLPKPTLEVFHGTRFDVKQFSTEAIGKGEGNQAFGHGLYFAGNKEVADYYRTAGKDIKKSPARKAQVLESMHGNEEARKMALQQLHEAQKNYDDARLNPDFAVMGQSRAKAIEELSSQVGYAAKVVRELDTPKVRREVKGNVYTVELNVNHENLIDWDKPLSEQSQQVQNAFAQYGITNPKQKGGDAYRELGIEHTQSGDQGASAILKDAGVKGISYLDGDSRLGTAKNKTTNYVLFDDKDAKIIEKNGIPVNGKPALFRDPSDYEKGEGATEYRPQTLYERTHLNEWKLNKGGQGVAERLAASVYSDHAALGKALLQFPELLKRIDAAIWNLPGGSFAGRTAEGRSQLLLDSSLLQADTETQERVFGHELLHGMTMHEVDNPTKAKYVEELTNLREDLINSLSKKGGDASDYAAMKRAIKSDWYNRWAAGDPTATPEELHAVPSTRKVLYGLLSNHELIAQGFTEEGMRKWMQSVKMKTAGTAWQKFTGWVKSLIGMGEEVSGTAFQRFMETTLPIFNQGEYVSTARNYFDRFFQNKGMNGLELADKTNRALGLVLGSASNDSNFLINHLFSIPESQNSQLKAAEMSAKKMFDASDAQTQSANAILQENGHRQGMDGLDSVAVNAAIKNDSNLRETLELLPTEASKYIFERWNDVKDVFDAVKGALSKENEGLLNIGDPAALRSKVLPVSKELAKLVKLQREHEDANVEMSQLQSINPVGLLHKALGGAKPSLDEIKKMVDPDIESKEFSNWVERNISLPYQIARQDPRAAEIVSKVVQQQANIHKMKSESLKVMGTDDIYNTLQGIKQTGVAVTPGQIGGNITKESLDRGLQVFKNPKLTKALNEWIFENQSRNRGAETVLPMNDPAVAKLLGNLTLSEKDAVNETIHKIMVSKQTHDSQIVEKMQQISSSAAVKVLGRVGREFGQELPASDRLTLASSLLEASLADFNDPQQAQAANLKVQQVSQRLPIEVFNELLKFTQVESEKIKLIRDNMAQRPGWVSGQDYGRYRIVWLDKNQKVHRWAGNDEGEAKAVAKQASKVVEFKDRANQDDEIHYPSMTPELIARIRQLEENSWDIQGLSAEQRQIAAQASVANQIEREAGAQGVPEVGPQGRRLSRGADTIPWAENHFSWVNNSSSAWTKRLLRTQYDTHLAEPEVANSDQYKGWVKDYVEGYLRKDPEGAAKLRRFTSMWFLGANLASAIANPIGNGMRMISELTAMSGKPVDSYKRFLSAAGEVAGNFRGKRPWANAEHEQLMKDAAHERQLSPTLYDEDAAANEAVTTKYKQLIEGQKPQTWGQRLGTVAGAFSQAAMWPFRIGETWNNQVGLLSAFDYYREQGLSYQDAKTKAYEFNGSVNDTGGRANRPVGPFSAQGNLPRSAALLATAMQNYTIGSTFQLIRYLKQGLFRPPGLTPHEVYSARKAGIQMLAMQFASAGVLGLPFVSGALALLDKEFPDLELNRKLRETVKDFFDGDQRGGSVLSDMAMTGVPSMFGWDLQSRLSMGNTVPGVSEMNGFQPEQLLGPPVSLLSQFVRGGQKLISGQGTVSDWTPPSVKKLTQLISSGGNSVNDYKGRPVLNDLTPGEKLGIGLGFQPKRLSDYNAASRIADQQQRVASSQENQYRQQLANDALKGNFGSVRSSLLDKAEADKTYDPVAAAKGIAKAAEELTFPVDLRRGGSLAVAPERRRLLEAFGVANQAPSEVARWQFRSKILSSLGVPNNDVEGLQKAQRMDIISQQHPDLTRSEVSRMAEVAGRASSRTLQPLQ